MRALARRVLVAWEAARGVVPMVVIEYGLRTRDLPTTCRWLGVAADLDSAAPPATEPVVLPRRSRRVLRGSLWLLEHWPAGDSCLRRSLLVGHRLRRSGPRLRVGVRRDADGAFAAHAWLELDGATFDPSAPAFTALGAPGVVA